MRTLLAAAVVFAPALALADAPSLGARVGGYGFRRAGSEVWDECRMNGVGVFGDQALRGPWFVEGGLDLYFSATTPISRPEDDLPIDRASALVTAAIGARATIGHPRLTGYTQLGLGLELTQVAVPYDGGLLEDRQALPDGFLGVGGELRLGTDTSIGANLRVHVMGNFTYDPAALEMQRGWTAPPAADEIFAPAPDLSAQAQFYLRRTL